MPKTVRSGTSEKPRLPHAEWLWAPGGIIGLVLMSGPAGTWGMLVGAVAAFAPLALLRGQLRPVQPPGAVPTVETIFSVVFAALAYSVASGAVLNAFGQSTFTDAMPTTILWMVPIVVVGIQASALCLYLLLRRRMPAALALTIVSVGIGIYHATACGWDWPLLLFVAAPLQAIFLFGFVKTQNPWGVFASAGVYSVLVAAMMAVPVPV